jgi:hypothetical protein
LFIESMIFADKAETSLSIFSDSSTGGERFGAGRITAAA